MRVVIGVVFAAGALILGAATACLTAINRARGANLDERQHSCETYLRRNELLEQQSATMEFHLLQGAEEPQAESTENPRNEPPIEH